MLWGKSLLQNSFAGLRKFPRSCDTRVLIDWLNLHRGPLVIRATAIEKELEQVNEPDIDFSDPKLSGRKKEISLRLLLSEDFSVNKLFRFL